MKPGLLLKWIGTTLLVGLFGAGCAYWGERREHHERTSLMDYLYPRREEVRLEPTVPTLKLPLRVGLAWVPASNRQGNRWSSDSEVLPPAILAANAARVRSQFTNLPFVAEVVVIPEAYLQAGGGFDNLEQLQAAFGIDVVALMSRDQKQFTDPNQLSLLYLTIVGAYTVPAEKNETYTMVDTAVFDIASRSLLFRAPGTSRVRSHATPIGLDEELRKNLESGMAIASTNMAANLRAELAAFQGRLKQDPGIAKVVHRPGYTGGGAGGWADGLLLAAVAGALAVGAFRRGRS